MTERQGTARFHPEAEEGSPGFAGILTGQENGFTRYIFLIHGMGPTERAFVTPLHDRLKEAGYSPVALGEAPVRDWTPVVLPAPARVSGGALDCSPGSAGPPCLYRDFGDYRIDEFKRNGARIIIYSYFWNDALQAAQTPFVANDDEVPRSKGIAYVKHRIVNYGFADAAAYLGPLGSLMRSGTEGAVCAMIRHAATGQPIPPGQPCRFKDLDPSEPGPNAQLIFISQSLGSRLLYDTINPAYSEPANDAEVRVKSNILESADMFFMLANQLPLLGLGQVRVDDGLGGEDVLDSEPYQDFFDVLARVRSSKSLDDGPGLSVSPDLGTLQIISFQDPEDLLGFRLSDDLRRLGEQNDRARIRFVEVVHRNTSVWGLGGRNLISLPNAAHAVELERDTSAALIFCGARVGKGGWLTPAEDCLSR